MKLVYIAGPYRSGTTFGLKKNIDKAERVAVKYWQLGYAVICPHKNTSFLDGTCSDKVFLDGDLEMLKRCDVIVMMKGWQKSKGAKTELFFAKANKIKVIYAKT